MKLIRWMPVASFIQLAVMVVGSIGCNSGIAIHHEGWTQNQHGKIQFATPKEWVRKSPTRADRLVQYSVPDHSGVAPPAEFCLVRLGPAFGRIPPHSSFAEWEACLTPDNNKDQIQKWLTVISTPPLRGSWLSCQGTLTRDGTTSPHMRILVGVIDTPACAAYFELSGKDIVVSQWVDTFEAVLQSLKSQ